VQTLPWIFTWIVGSIRGPSTAPDNALPGQCGVPRPLESGGAGRT